MPNVFVSLPVPAGNGVGAAVDVSAMGAFKTIAVVGGFQAVLSVEVSEDGINFGPLITFTSPDVESVETATQWMRVRIAGYEAGALPTSVTIGSNDLGALFFALTVPAGNGTGAATNVSTLGIKKTIIVSGPFSGSIIIEASEDGVGFAPLLVLTGPDAVFVEAVAQHLRVTVAGYEAGPLPTVTVGGANDPTGITSLNQLDWKEPVRLATTANIVLSGLQVIDGVLTVAGDRVLVKNQATSADNGIYIASAGAWARSADANTSAEVKAGLTTIVTEGSVQADTGWTLVTNNPITLGVTSLLFLQRIEGLSTVAPVTIVPDAVGAAGTSLEASRSDHVHGIAAATAVEISDATNDEGVSTSFSRADHLHAHGNRGGGSLHALVTTLVAGFMSAADKTKLDGIQANAAPAVFGFGDGNVGAAADTRFLGPWFGGQGEVASTSIIDIIAPRAGVLDNLFVRHNAATGNGNNVVYTVMLNGVATALTVTRATGAVGTSSDLVNTVTVAQGDRIALQATKAAAIGNGGCQPVASIRFRS